MSYKEMIPGSFGSVDKIFSGQHNDTNRAKDMLIKALQETDSWSEFEKSIRDYLFSEGCTPSHIEEQMQRVLNTRNYFNYD